MSDETTPPSKSEALRERARYAAEAIRVHADKFPVPKHMRAHAAAIDELAALSAQPAGDAADAEGVEALNMARDLICEAKGAEGPNGGFVTNHLDAAEGWLDKVEAALTTKADAAGEGVEAPNVYQIGNAMFVGIRAFLNSAAIDASKCKVVIEMPDRDTARRLVGALRHDAWPAPPNSAARHGNYSGFWQGVEYEFSVKGWSASRDAGADAMRARLKAFEEAVATCEAMENDRSLPKEAHTAAWNLKIGFLHQATLTRAALSESS